MVRNCGNLSSSMVLSYTERHDAKLTTTSTCGCFATASAILV